MSWGAHFEDGDLVVDGVTRETVGGASFLLGFDDIQTTSAVE